MTTLLSVRTSAAERVTLELTAEAAGMKLSDWARTVLVRATLDGSTKRG
jgi:hypothetical protein